MKQIACPRCRGEELIKSGVVKERQRFRCKKCQYSFTVMKEGKNIDPYYVIKALQLYLEGITYREIERILGISHVSVMNWVKNTMCMPPNSMNTGLPTKCLPTLNYSTISVRKKH